MTKVKLADRKGTASTKIPSKKFRDTWDSIRGKNCDECILLSVTEEEQYIMGNQHDHVCYKTGERLRHGNDHPYLRRPDWCIVCDAKRVISSNDYESEK